MKKSKVILAIVLAVILLVVCVNAPTFSWFTRPYPTTDADYTGNALALTTKNVYTAYNGHGVSMTTTACTTGAAADYASVTTAEGLGGSIGTSVSGNRKYYCTTITNTGNNSTAQNVSLYAHALHSNTIQFALGVNSPTRTYHDFSYQGSGIGVKTACTTRRVYMQRPEQDNDDYEWGLWTTGGNYDVDYWDASSVHSGGEMVYFGDNNVYYHDIPTTTTGLFFKIRGSNMNGSNDPKQKTEDVNVSDFPTDSAVRVFVWHERNNYSVAKVNWDRVEGADFYHYYSTITMDPDSTFDASLHWPDVQGNVKYYAEGDNNPFTVDENTGIITATDTGTGYLKTETTGGAFSDKKSVTTTVTIQANQSGYDYTDEPIVKNIYVPAHAGRGQDGDPPAIKVYWYIKNNSGSSMTYTIDRIYLGM